MRRIAWPLLSALLLAAAPAAGNRRATGTAPSPSNRRRARSTRGGIAWPRASSAPSPAADPGSARAWFGLGKSYEALARESFQKLQATAPDSAWEALIVAEVLVSGERFAQALSLYREVQQAEPEIGGVHEAIADLYERAGKARVGGGRAREGRRRVRATARRSRPSAATWHGKYLDVVAAAEGRADAPSLYWATRAYNALATEAFATLETLPASAEVHVVLASVHRDQGRPTEAVPELKAALALRPGDRAIEEELAVGALRIQKPGRSAAVAGAPDGPCQDGPNGSGVFLRRCAAAGPAGRGGAALSEGRRSRSTRGHRRARVAGPGAAAVRRRRRGAAAPGGRGRGRRPAKRRRGALSTGAGLSTSGTSRPGANWRWRSTRSDRPRCRPRRRRLPRRAGKS